MGIRKGRLVGPGQREPLSLLPVVPLASEMVVGYTVRSVLCLHHTLLRSVSLTFAVARIFPFAAQVGAYDHTPVF
ncbi:MAG TPA: hypothetical protein EYP17_06405 [Candidatus Latescibacteria bacterium]|nr:hypothetical protein [Candidatus Latescibacterota bacterium]